MRAEMNMKKISCGFSIADFRFAIGKPEWLILITAAAFLAGCGKTNRQNWINNKKALLSIEVR